MTTHPAPPRGVNTTVTTTATDVTGLQRSLEGWIRDRLATPTARISDLRKPSESGMSSISVLFTVEWDLDGSRQRADLVARLAPEPTALPVFPGYDLERQAAVMRTVADHSTVPVPRVRWIESSPAVLGRPFVVMDRVDGVVPVDNPPYVFGGWLHEATTAQLDVVQHGSVDVLAGIHSIPDPRSLLPELGVGTADDALRRHVDGERAYYEWTRQDDGLRIPLLERGFDWLEENWPSSPSEPVLCWGDSRIGNIMYRDFAPAAVLDWELATLAPRELDVGWFVFFHRMYQDMAEQFGRPGLPGFLQRADVVAHYENTTGVELRDLDFYLGYAAIRHGIIMSRIKRRSIHFGDSPAPDDPDEYVLHHRMLRRLIENEYSWETM
ncbi:phosphotransferase family protein [Rhodococcus sp. AG1013]|uniref:phosphotransferase family protein n=1 Tax=unclassified Rhodococcus (in: high G+C Gram-positive bacteria) TaxID=192944 RepID=UPI000E0BE2EF|nr:phosphotransferase family protein [Rhodococcus sp. AG1013]RDI30402.1 aminoglycoside phosphotransferase (APT) family kinase protein [Rhodococcus sp. AG1013]